MSNRPPSPKYASQALENKSKGKAKIEDTEMDDSQYNCCGICLHEESKAIRGLIDSCDHFFCFVCIMEWSKVESRCPMCKSRFSSINRPPFHAAFDSERIFNIPIRDQAEKDYDDSTMVAPDPHLEAKCSVCNGTQEENLLLLCDLCDSAAHTFCVGLGSIVPEENWYCHECTILKDEHARNESPHERNATLFEIVHDPELNPCTIKLPKFRMARKVSSPKQEKKTVLSGSSDSESQIARRVTLPKQELKTEPSGSSDAESQIRRRFRSAEQDPKTVPSESSDAETRIGNLRQNWNAFQTGSMNFNSKSAKIQNTSNRQPKAVSDSRAKDVEKAWKMLKTAKLITRGVVRSVSKPYPREVNNVVKDANVGTTSTVLNSKKRVAEDPTLGRLDNKNKAIQVCNPRESVREPPKNIIIGETSNHYRDQQKKCKTEKSCSDDKAKSEIISLVKLNLKLLSRDKKLEVGLFKEVARLSTHSILAACGLEMPKQGVRTFNDTICRHMKKGEQIIKSTLMPGSCRECFFRFVKDVVNSIVIEKVG